MVKKSYKQFLRDLPTAYQAETYNFCGIEWDVSKARYFIFCGLAKACYVNTRSIAAANLLDYPNDDRKAQAIESMSSTSSYPMRDVDQYWIDKAIEHPELNLIDLSQPIILSAHSIGKSGDRVLNVDDRCLILIDGAHRVRYGFLTGADYLPCFVIPEHLDRVLIS